MLKTVKVADHEMNKATPLISIVYSFYNEQSVLRELINRTRTVMREEMRNGSIRDYEILFVNDASTDLSRNILLEEAELGRDIILVDMSRNFGVSECVLAGFRLAKGDAVVYLDADLQDPPELIPEMIAMWKQDLDMEVVYTTRKTRAGEHPLKMALTRFGYRFINRLSEIELPVDSGDFKLLSRRAVEHVLQLKEQRPYLRGMVSWIGFKQGQILYDREGRGDGRENTKFPVLSRRVIYGYLDRALISFSDAPLKIMLFLGLGVSVLALAYVLVVLVQKILGLYEPGWPALMAAILLLGGIQLSLLGVMGLYLTSIFLQVKERPLGIVDKVTAPLEKLSGRGVLTEGGQGQDHSVRLHVKSDSPVETTV